MKVKGESGKAGLKFNIKTNKHKNKTMEFGPNILTHINGIQLNK